MGEYTVFYLKEAFIDIYLKEYIENNKKERKIAWHKITQTDVSTQKNVFRSFRYKKKNNIYSKEKNIKRYILWHVILNVSIQGKEKENWKSFSGFKKKIYTLLIITMKIL